MSHLGTRLLADRFADPDEGLNSLVQEMTEVVYPGDALPDTPVTIYDDTRHPLVCNVMAPLGDLSDDDVQYPCIRLITLGVDSPSTATEQSTGAVTVKPTLRIAAQLLLRDSEDARASDGMYLLRAMRGVLYRFDDPANEAARTACGTRLYPSISCSQGKIDAPLGDNITSPGTLILTFPVEETVPLPLSLH
jgi:hypothetical protein